MPFTTFKLHPALLAALPEQYQTPTAIQQQALPLIIEGQDVVALAPTGSGKTLAFGLGLLHQLSQLDSEPTEVRAVIIVPTRELAAQISDVLIPLTKALSLKLTTLCGGAAVSEQAKEFNEQTPALVVATPGRLLDLVKQRLISLATVQHLVLDEVDRLLDMGLWPDVQRILQNMPIHRQQLLFSATLSDELATQVALLAPQAKRVSIGAESPLAKGITQQCYLVNKGSKAQALIALLSTQLKQQQVLVFINARDSADALAKRLNKTGVVALALHGEKDQAERAGALQAFKEQKIKVLVTTDLLARGIDIAALPVVINLDLPPSAPVYIHRVGRTARAGLKGVAISLVCHGELPALTAIRELTGVELPLLPLDGFPVTDQPATNERKRPVRDKKANRRQMNKHKGK